MAIRFQYNKISLKQMQQQLKIRLDALPVLKFKEAVLRSEAEKAKKTRAELEQKLYTKIEGYTHMDLLWQEFPLYALAVRHVITSTKNIAGVRVPKLENVEFDQQPVCWFTMPTWIPDGMWMLRELACLAIEQRILSETAVLLEKARKKTTQKVNLYEKVQVPGYSDAIGRITKYLDDEEALGKAIQKIMKNKIISL